MCLSLDVIIAWKIWIFLIDSSVSLVFCYESSSLHWSESMYGTEHSTVHCNPFSRRARLELGPSEMRYPKHWRKRKSEIITLIDIKEETGIKFSMRMPTQNSCKLANWPLRWGNQIPEQKNHIL